MKIINSTGIALISLFFLFLGAYYIVYAKVLYTATTIISCWGMDCLTLLFLRILSYVLGVIGIIYIILAIAIRFHRAGFYLALAACIFNILLMVTYLLSPSIFSLWLTFIFPIRVILSRGLEYAPTEAGDWVSLLESGFEVLMILINIGIAAYLLRCMGRGVWGSEGEKDEDDVDDELSEEELRKEVRETYKQRK